MALHAVGQVVEAARLVGHGGHSPGGVVEGHAYQVLGIGHLARAFM